MAVETEVKIRVTDLPDLSQFVADLATVGDDEVNLAIWEEGDGTHTPDYYKEFVELSDNVRKHMGRKDIATVPTARKEPDRMRAHRTTTAFRASAHRARGE